MQEMILNRTKDSQSIDIVFDMYLENSIKTITIKSGKKNQ